MPEPTTSEYRRRDDAAMRQFTDALKENNKEIRELREQFHSLEVNLAENHGQHKAEADHLHYRVTELEEWKGAMNKYVATLFFSVAGGFILFVMQWFFSNGVSP